MLPGMDLGRRGSVSAAKWCESRRRENWPPASRESVCGSINVTLLFIGLNILNIGFCCQSEIQLFSHLFFFFFYSSLPLCLFIGENLLNG